MINKEMRKIKSLIAVINDSAASENEKQVSGVKVVRYCKKLISGAGIDAYNINNWIISGLMRQLFEGKSIQLWHDDSDIEKVKKVLLFYGIPFNEKKKFIRLT
ncbi:hypothetical protein MOC30_14665 [Bacillus spizizenii]|nr:hypothetical protein [Bacillus spizizenii]